MHWISLKCKNENWKYKQSHSVIGLSSLLIVFEVLIHFYFILVTSF